MTDKAIICSRKKCSYRMMESWLNSVPHPTCSITRLKVCPACGCESYYIMNEGQIKWWEKKKHEDAIIRSFSECRPG